MSASKARKPRRKPLQERSKVTVDAIIEATAQVLVAEGSYRSTTTNRIAERAGVSIGTLYQYFPNKDALILGLIQQRRAERVGVLLETVQSMAQQPLAGALRALIPLFVRMRREEDALYALLDRQISRLGRVEEMHRASRQVAALVAPLLEARRDEVRPTNIPRAARFMVAMADQLTTLEFLDEAPTEALLDEVIGEIAEAIIRYVCREPTAG